MGETNVGVSARAIYARIVSGRATLLENVLMWASVIIVVFQGILPWNVLQSLFVGIVENLATQPAAAPTRAFATDVARVVTRPGTVMSRHRHLVM